MIPTNLPSVEHLTQVVVFGSANSRSDGIDCPHFSQFIFLIRLINGNVCDDELNKKL